MKLSYREKIGLLIFLVVVVIIIFVAWPIKLIRGNIETHTVEQAKVKEDYDTNQRLIAQIPGIESNINKTYEETKGLSEKFASHVENIGFDKYFQQLLNKEPYKKAPLNALEITDSLSIADAGTEGIEFYYYTPNVITYPILEKADTNGDLITKDSVLFAKVNKAVYMQTLESQTVEARTVSIPMKFTKEALLALEDELKKEGTGIRITDVTIDDYTFNLLSEIPEDKGYSNGNVSFTFYTMQQIQKPDFSK